MTYFNAAMICASLCLLTVILLPPQSEIIGTRMRIQGSRPRSHCIRIIVIHGSLLTKAISLEEDSGEAYIRTSRQTSHTNDAIDR
jgi:hypothetical protein